MKIITDSRNLLWVKWKISKIEWILRLNDVGLVTNMTELVSVAGGTDVAGAAACSSDVSFSLTVSLWASHHPVSPQVGQPQRGRLLNQLRSYLSRSIQQRVRLGTTRKHCLSLDRSPAPTLDHSLRQPLIYCLSDPPITATSCDGIINMCFLWLASFTWHKVLRRIHATTCILRFHQ